jgi:uncharacterized protein YggT (Ycf19 family)
MKNINPCKWFKNTAAVLLRVIEPHVSPISKTKPSSQHGGRPEQAAMLANYMN